MTRIAESFDKRAALVKATLSANKGEIVLGEPSKGLLSAESIKQNILLDMKEAVTQADAVRNGGRNSRPMEYSIEDIAKHKFGFGSLDGFYRALDINPSIATVDSLASMSDFNEGYRWIIPEVVREAVSLGLRRNPVYPDLIAAEESVDQKKVTMPHVNMSDATPERLEETETIPVGSLSFGEKDIKLHKIGTGLTISDEVQKYVSLNILSIYLQDAGVKLGLGLDTMAIDVLLNGDGGSSNYAAPVIGVDNVTNGITYKDLLRAWIRMGRIGRLPSGMLSDEDAALNILQLPEFKGANYNNRLLNVNVKTPIPQSQDYLIHGAMPSGPRLGLVDNTSALMKLNASALMVESERIVRRQMNGTYMTLTTGFAKLFRDSFLVIDGTLDYATNGFPAFMDVSAAENISF